MQNNKFSVKSKIKSFGYAFNGLRILVKTEHNARIHIVIAIIVVVLGFLLHISYFEWIAVIFAIGSVLSIEIINSAIEYLADYVSPDYNKQIEKVKDLSAAAVLIATMSAVIIGLLVFIPKLFTLC